MRDQESYPLPEDQALADAARAIGDAGHWGWVVDDRWRVVWASDDLRLSFGALTEFASFPKGVHMFGSEWLEESKNWRQGANSLALNRGLFRAVGGMALADMPGGRDELRELVDPALRDIVDELTPAEGSMLAYTSEGYGGVGNGDIPGIAFRIRDTEGRLAGTALIS